jgi:pantoate--beta-alanine ligase
MILFKKQAAISEFLHQKTKKGHTIGFVPTMGALHKGHISLIDNCKKTCDITVSSIFVNPTQFNDKSDYEKYPITISKDINMLEEAGCDVLFLPSAAEIYPAGTQNLQLYNLGYLETVLEGQYRPGHFQGVCQVVHLLLQIVQPQQLFLGQKDYQQCMVIKKMIELTGLTTSVTVCNTLRETDGLAMSSRNMRLTPQEREKATIISSTLNFIKREIKPGNIDDLKERALNHLKAEGFTPDYVEVADANTLEIINNWNGQTKLVALIAAFLNHVRLIDNMPLQ